MGFSFGNGFLKRAGTGKKIVLYGGTYEKVVIPHRHSELIWNFRRPCANALIILKLIVDTVTSYFSESSFHYFLYHLQFIGQ